MEYGTARALLRAADFDLDSISPKRAQVIEMWQGRTTKPESKRRYSTAPDANRPDKMMVRIDRESAFRHRQLDN